MSLGLNESSVLEETQNPKFRLWNINKALRSVLLVLYSPYIINQLTPKKEIDQEPAPQFEEKAQIEIIDGYH